MSPKLRHLCTSHNAHFCPPSPFVLCFDSTMCLYHGRNQRRIVSSPSTSHPGKVPPHLKASFPVPGLTGKLQMSWGDVSSPPFPGLLLGKGAMSCSPPLQLSLGLCSLEVPNPTPEAESSPWVIACTVVLLSSEAI